MSGSNETTKYPKVYTANAVANAFIRLANKDEVPITNMKLQKLVYIANGYCLAILDRPLFDNDVHAFEWGPVIPTLYNKLKKFGSSEITKDIDSDDPELIENGRAVSIVNEVWNAYKDIDAARLSAITHREETPWFETWNKKKYGIIDPVEIQKHYQKLLSERAGIKYKREKEEDIYYESDSHF